MTDQGGRVEGLDLRRILGALSRRRRIIVIVVAAMLLTALGLSFLQTDVYQGEARVRVQPGGGATLFGSRNGAEELDPELVIETEIEILTGEELEATVAERVGPVPEAEVERVGQTLLLAVKVESTSAQRAADVANAYATTYVDFRQRQAADELLAVGEELLGKLREIQTEIDDLEVQIGGMGVGEQEALSAQLERRDALIGKQARFAEKLDEIEVEASLTSGGARLVTTAAVPTVPIRPKPLRNTALAGVVGLFVGIGLASLLEVLDSSVRSKEEVSRALDGVPVLGVIPVVPGWNKPGSVFVGSTLDREVPAMEAYRSVRTSLQLLGTERPVRSLQVTSPNAGEGKTTTLVALAVLFASAGQRVVAVDFDLRRPKLHLAFGLTNEVGFTSVLARVSPLADAIQQVPEEKNLMILSSGPALPNPSEVLGSRSTSEVLFALQSQADLVLVDSPPVLPVTDATVMSPWVEGTLIVASADLTTKSQLRDAADLLRRADASLVGAVLNRAASRPGYGYGYGYGDATYDRKDGDFASRRRVDVGRWMRRNPMGYSSW